MKILLVNKFHYLKGGSEKYYFELGDLLKKHGHQIAFFSMKSDKNLKTKEKEYFVDEIDLNTGSKLKALDVIYSKENKIRMLQAIDEFKPDIIHLNNFQRQLSESIVEAANEKNIPIVFTAHDVQAVCPAITMLDNNKQICELCKNGKYFNCIKKRCVKNSMLKSILAAAEGKFYRVKKVYNKKIDWIITPSEFYKQKMIEDGIEEKHITAIHNFIELDKYDLETQDDGYGLYIGRLSKEKGILNLIEAFSNIKDRRLYIAGDGPERERIESIIKEKNLKDRITLLGYINQEEVKEYLRKARFVVVPSIWYENCPYSVMETLAIGKPVIGANIAGIPELVKDKVNGLLYKYDSISDLEVKMKRLYENPELAKQYGENAKKIAIDNYGKEKYYNQVIDIYNKVLKEN